MPFHYSDPSRANDQYSLPDVEVFYVAAKEFDPKDTDTWMGAAIREEMRAEDLDDPDAVLLWQSSLEGWYWRACFPGCLPDGDEIGPFGTEEEALAGAREDLADVVACTITVDPPAASPEEPDKEIELFALSARELATVLGALRVYQRDIGEHGPEIDDIVTDGGEEEPLSAGEIDTLCERLNVEDAPVASGLAAALALVRELRDYGRAEFGDRWWPGQDEARAVRIAELEARIFAAGKALRRSL